MSCTHMYVGDQHSTFNAFHDGAAHVIKHTHGGLQRVWIAWLSAALVIQPLALHLAHGSIKELLLGLVFVNLLDFALHSEGATRVARSFH